MMKMKVVGIIAVFLVLASGANAQAKKEVVQLGIEVKRTYDISIKDGDKERYLDKEEFFNAKGELVEDKEYSEKGKKVKYWYKYKYDAAGNVVEMLELDANGGIVKKTAYKFEGMLKKERLEYDGKGRLLTKRDYEYTIRK
jgi:hypothetical protein